MTNLLKSFPDRKMVFQNIQDGIVFWARRGNLEKIELLKECERLLIAGDYEGAFEVSNRAEYRIMGQAIKYHFRTSKEKV